MTSKDSHGMPTTVHTTDLNTANSITTLAQGSMFWRPVFLTQSDWLEHIPFAFWLIEAHKPSTVVEIGTQEGASYFAMCQAIDRLHLDASCFAVNTWTDEDLNGTPSQEMYLSVKEHNEAHYSSFSSLVKSSSVQALEHFTDNSIDLIHFDGLNGYDAASQLVNAWMPKLSDKGLILIHDTNVRKENMHVHRLFEDLSGSYPAFEFRHGHGLGVLGVGADQSELIQVLFDDANNRSNNQVIQDVFSRLGRACADSYSARVSEQNTTELAIETKTLKADLESVEMSLLKARSMLDEKSNEMHHLQQRIQQQFETHALERGQLVERSSMIQKLHDELKSNTAELQHAVGEATSKLTQQSKEMFQFAGEKTLFEKQLSALQDEQRNQQKALIEKDHECVSLKQELEASRKKLNDELTGLKKKLENSREESKKDTQVIESKYGAELANKNASLKTLEKDLESQTDSANALSKEIATITKSVESKEQAHKQEITNIREQLKVQLKSLKVESDAALTDKNTSLKALEKELKSQTHSVTALIREVSDATSLMDATENKHEQEMVTAREQFAVQLKTIKAENESALMESKSSMKELEQELEVTKKEIQSIIADKSGSVGAIEKELKSTKEKYQSELAGMKATLEEQKTQLKLQKDSVAARFQEIAIMTKLLESKEEDHQNQLESMARNGTNQLVQTRVRLAHLYKGKGTKLFRRREVKNHILIIKGSGLFDAEWYLAQYPDIGSNAEFAANPLLHFVQLGGFEGRNPNEKFNTTWYLEQNQDVAMEGANPLVHYIQYGKSEGRLPGPPSDTT